MKLGRRQTPKSLTLNTIAMLILVAGFWARWAYRGTTMEFLGPLLGLLGIGAFVMSQSETRRAQTELRLDTLAEGERSRLSWPLYTSIAMGITSLICVALLAIAAYATRAAGPLVVITAVPGLAYFGSIVTGAAFWARFDRLQRDS